jgi:hypothetical protein
LFDFEHIVGAVRMRWSQSICRIAAHQKGVRGRTLWFFSMLSVEWCPDLRRTAG